MRVGIFAGTFDPIHRGHIAFALAAAQQLALDKVLVMPERSPRGKLGASDFKHRANMARLVTSSHRKLKTLVLGDQNFTTAHTLPQIEKLYPGAELFMLLGSDVVKTFGFRWPGLESLLARVQLAVSLRAGEAEADIRSFLEGLGTPLRAHMVSGPHAHLRATDVRLGNIQGIEAVVRDYIAQNQLYQPAAS